MLHLIVQELLDINSIGILFPPPVKEYWRLNMYIPFMDHLRAELEGKLCIPEVRLKAVQTNLPTKPNPGCVGRDKSCEWVFH